MKIDWKKIAPYLVALVVFIGFALSYCSPLLNGKELYAGDEITWLGGANETIEYNKTHEENTWWTNSMFGGMPTFQIAGRTPSASIRAKIDSICRLGMTKIFGSAGIIFTYFCGFFLLLICFGVNPWLSIVGALAMGMSSYYFLILPAGHFTKAMA